MGYALTRGIRVVRLDFGEVLLAVSDAGKVWNGLETFGGSGRKRFVYVR